MRKNVASQVVVAQLVSKTDGSAVTGGTTTCYVLGDGGTQATGSVGSGACTHEGNGVWSYAPAQAETNYDHVAYTFVNSSAVNATIQIYPSFPQTGDNFARIGAPVGASISADIAAVQADTDNIQTRIPAALVSGRMDASVGAVATGAIDAGAIAADALGSSELAASAASKIATAVRTELATELARIDAAVTTRASQTSLDAVDDYVDTEIAAIKAKTDNLPSDPADASDIASAFSTVNGTLSTIAGYIDTEVAAIKAKTDQLSFDSGNVLADLRAISAASAADIAGAVWEEALGDHSATSGSTAEAMAAAGGAGDPWITPLPGSYSSGQAGYILGTNLNATVSSRATQTSVDDVPTNAELASALASADDAMLAAVGVLPTAAAIAAAVHDEALSGHTTPGTAGAALNDTDKRGARTVVRGTVSSTSPSTTSFTPSALSPSGAAADQFKGRILIFDNDTATASLRGQATDITASSAASLPVLTVTALTTAPASGDTFSIV